MQQARAGVNRQISTRSSVDIGYVGRLFPENRLGPFADVFDRHQSHAVLVGFTRQVAPSTALTLQAGPRNTTYRGMTAEVLAALNHDGNRAKWGIDFWRGETIILGVEGPVAIDTANARVTWTATRKVEVGLRTGASHIITLDDRAATIYRATLVGSWTFAGPLTLTTSYSADYQVGDIRRNFFADDKVLRHVIRVGADHRAAAQPIVPAVGRGGARQGSITMTRYLIAASIACRLSCRDCIRAGGRGRQRRQAQRRGRQRPRGRRQAGRPGRLPIGAGGRAGHLGVEEPRAEPHGSGPARRQECRCRWSTTSRPPA